MRKNKEKGWARNGGGEDEGKTKEREGKKGKKRELNDEGLERERGKRESVRAGERWGEGGRGRESGRERR
eukprot:4031946-Pleurochrysis_carterae.AAC.1